MAVRARLKRPGAYGLAVLALLAGVGAVRADSSARVVDHASLELPVRAAFFYPWYPETEHWATRYRPTLGRYDSSDRAVIDRQIDGMRHAGLHAAIASWWGPRSKTDRRFDDLLAGARRDGKGFRFAPYYECEGNTGSRCPAGAPDPTQARIEADLAYIRRRYARHPSYLRVGGEPVVFVYSANDADCSVADRWKAAADRQRFYVSLKVFPGYRPCANQPDAWHQYAPAVREDRQRGYSFSVSAGFYQCHGSGPRLARDLRAFRRSVRHMIASGEPWQLVYWNEWCEGSSVESAGEWASKSGFGRFADVLHAAARRQARQRCRRVHAMRPSSRRCPRGA